MRSPFSFISSNPRVVTLDMFPFQLGDFAPPEIAVPKLRVRNRQVRLADRLVPIANDIEVERPRSPALASFSAPLRLDATAVFEERRRLQRSFEQDHLVQIRRLRNRPPPERCRLLDTRRRDETSAGQRAQA